MYKHIYIRSMTSHDVPVHTCVYIYIYIFEDLNLVPIVMGGSGTFCY